MESEKVKEIKEALELNEYYAIEYFPKSGEPKIFTFNDILTLINELESENERLNKSDTSKENAMNEYYNLYKDFKRENQQLKDENERWKGVFDIANEREYRKKFNDEWRKEYQKELDKQGNGHIAGFPDFDLVEQKDRIAELEKENEAKTDTIIDLLKKQEFYETEKLKQFAEKLKIECVNKIQETLKEFINSNKLCR